MIMKRWIGKFRYGPLAYSEYESLEDIVYELLAKYGLDASQIGLTYTNSENG